MPWRADPSQGFRGARRVAKSHNKRSVSNEQEELKPMWADPSQGFRGARRGWDLPWLLMLSGFHCYISGITNEKVGLFAKTSQSQQPKA